MNKTQNDLSYDSTNLDYQALITTARIAKSRGLREISRYLNNLQNFPPKSSDYLDAQYLAEEAGYLVIVCETLHSLEGGLTRSQLEIVNKPEVKEKDNGKDNNL